MALHTLLSLLGLGELLALLGLLLSLELGELGLLGGTHVLEGLGEFRILDITGELGLLTRLLALLAGLLLALLGWGLAIGSEFGEGKLDLGFLGEVGGEGEFVGLGWFVLG